MATLILPKIAVRLQDNNGKGKGKWHLLNPRGPEWEMTVCKFSYGEPFPIRARISELKAKDICQRCLGPMECKE